MFHCFHIEFYVLEINYANLRVTKYDYLSKINGQVKACLKKQRMF